MPEEKCQMPEAVPNAGGKVAVRLLDSLHLNIMRTRSWLHLFLSTDVFFHRSGGRPLALDPADKCSQTRSLVDSID